MDKPGVWGQSPQQAQVRCRRSGVSLRTPVPEAQTLACVHIYILIRLDIRYNVFIIHYNLEIEIKYKIK